MTDDPDIDTFDLTTYTADPHDPEALAREAVEAMRATGPVSAELERAMLGGARRHAEFTAKLRHTSAAVDG